MNIKILDYPKNSKATWCILKSNAGALFNCKEMSTMPQDYSETAIRLPDEAVQLILKYEEAAWYEMLHHGLKESAKNSLILMLGTSEQGFTENRIVLWRNTKVKCFKEEELRENEPELYRDYTYTKVSRKFSIL